MSHKTQAKEYELANNQAMQSRDDYKLIWKLAFILGWLAVGLFAANTAFHFEGLFNLIGVSLELILVILTFTTPERLPKIVSKTLSIDLNFE